MGKAGKGGKVWEVGVMAYQSAGVMGFSPPARVDKGLQVVADQLFMQVWCMLGRSKAVAEAEQACKGMDDDDDEIIVGTDLPPDAPRRGVAQPVTW